MTILLCLNSFLTISTATEGLIFPHVKKSKLIIPFSGNVWKLIWLSANNARIVKKEFNRDTRSLYHDIYSSPGLQKSYVVNEVLEDFKSKVGQHIEILELEQFGKSLFIDGEIQVAESDEHLYSSTFVGAGLN